MKNTRQKLSLTELNNNNMYKNLFSGLPIWLVKTLDFVKNIGVIYIIGLVISLEFNPIDWTIFDGGVGRLFMLVILVSTVYVSYE